MIGTKINKQQYLWAILVVVWLYTVLLPGGAAAAELSADYNPAVIRLADGGEVPALQQGGNVWVTVADIKKYFNPQVQFEAAEKKLYWYMSDPAQQLGEKRLPAAVFGTTLNFETKWLASATYINIVGLTPLLGGTLITDTVDAAVLHLVRGGEAVKPAPAVPRQSAQRISLVWDINGNATSELYQQPRIPGVTVVSPTWFKLSTASGWVDSTADYSYVAQAHAKGYQVWALVNNSFNPVLTQEFLRDEAAQERMISQLAAYAALYKLDGMNIDFENIYMEDKERLTSFVAKLTLALHQQQLTVSMDVTFPSDSETWSRCYDRAALGEIVDYMAVMAYDEHGSASRISGSGASLSWVRQGMKAMLTEVPGHKLLLGLPFYTREWEEMSNGQARPKTLSMAEVKARIEKYKADVTWLEDKGQYYAEYKIDGKLRQVWVEDEASLAKKVELVDGYGLAGTAAWRKGFEQPEVWSLLGQLNKKRL